MSRPKVSIIVLNWNGEAKLRKTLDSLTQISYPNYEVIVVDNDSEDDSVAVAKETLAGEDAIIIENGENYGYSKGKNIGAAQATGDFLWLLDNDIIVEESTLSTLVSKMEEDPECGACVPAIQFVSDDPAFGERYSLGQFFRFPFDPDYKLSNELPEDREIEVSIAAGAVILIRRRLWERLGGYDEACEMKLDQNDISMKLWITGYKCMLYTDALVTHLGKPGSNISDYNWYNYNYTKGRYRLMLKNYELKHLLLTLPLFFFWSIISTGRWILKSGSMAAPIHGWMRAHADVLRELPGIFGKRKYVQRIRSESDAKFFKSKVEFKG